MAQRKILSIAQRIGVVLAAIFYVVAGALHFIKPEHYFKKHASLYTVARGDGSRQQRF